MVLKQKRCMEKDVDMGQCEGIITYDEDKGIMYCDQCKTVYEEDD